METKAKRYTKPEAVKMLEQMEFERRRLKFPTIPTTHLVKDSFRDDKANDLTKCVCKFIQLKGGQAERISTTGRPIDHRQQFTNVLGQTVTMGRIEWIRGTVTPGSADISATICGRSVKIEVKIGKDFQSQAQKNYQQAIEAAGGLYFIAKDFTSFVEWYSKTFAP